MELAEILAVFRRRRAWLVSGVVVSLAVALSTIWSVGLSGAERRSRVAAFAQGQMFVDSVHSSLFDLSEDTTALTVRAHIYAQFMRSNSALKSIASYAHVPISQLVIDRPVTAAQGTQNIPRPGPARAVEVRAEETRFRVAFVAQPGLPVVTIHSQAPTAGQALDLVEAAVRVSQDDVARLDPQGAVKRQSRTRVVEMGSPVVSFFNGRADLAVAVLAFVVTLTTILLAIVAADAAVVSRRSRFTDPLVAPGLRRG